MIVSLVQHHPARAHLLPALLERLPAGTKVVTDPEPDGIPNPLRTYRECLRQIPEDATHALIVQDDATPHPDFPTVIERCVAARPDRIICFFVATHPPQGARRMLEAASRGDSWSELISTEFLPVVATCWPAPLAREFLVWCERLIAQHKRSDDGAAGRWIRQQSIRPVATVPCLVQHPDVETSLIGKRAMAGANRARVALLDPEGHDILSIGWG